MKNYIVELRYTVYKQYELQAESFEQAEALAWQEQEKDAGTIESCGEWECDSIEELQP